MTGRQFVAVKFRSGDRKSFTYHWDGEPLACGDVVKVPDRDGDGWQRVTVHEIGLDRPAFATKAILGRLGDGPGFPPADLPPTAAPLFAPADLPADPPSIVDRFRR